MPPIPTLDENEYLEIEEAVATTARGRAFLRMRDRRASLISAHDGRQLVSEIVSRLEAREIRKSSTTNLELMQRDLKDLRDHIERSKGEIAALVGKDGKTISGARLNGATDELYEIVAATERATTEILGAAEWIQDRVGSLPIAAGDRRDFEARCMEIFTACSFQDITGQRIAKVVATMGYVEQRVNTMMSMWDSEGTGGTTAGIRTGIAADGPRASADRAVASADGEQGLLNGPQLPGLGLGQDAVDALFGRADPPAPTLPEAARPAAEARTQTRTAPKAPAPPAGLRPSAANPAKKPAKPPPAIAALPIAATAERSAAPAEKKPPEAAKLDQSDVDALFN